MLYNGVPGDPELRAEPGCAPASRYVLETPNNRTTFTGWTWPASWTPPPDFNTREPPPGDPPAPPAG
jgi:hypothetical protein